MNDVFAGKVRNIRNCVTRLRAVDPGTLEGIERDQLVQESLVLNVRRACQAAIDLATHLVQVARLGPPDDRRGAFCRLATAGRLAPKSPTESPTRIDEALDLVQPALCRHPSLTRYAGVDRSAMHHHRKALKLRAQKRAFGLMRLRR